MTPLKTVLYATTALLFLNACSNETEKKPETVIEQKVNTTGEAVKPGTAVEHKVNTTVEATKQETVLDTQIEAVKEANKNVEAIIAKSEKVAEEISAVTTETSSGSALYSQKCASCHGKDAKKSALNASQVIAGWTTKKTKDALNGYKAGTFGGKMKGIMEGQSRPLSDAEITLIAEYISIL